MTFFEYFYCRAYIYYNVKKYKKSDDTLRVSALSLLTMFQVFNILTIIFAVSLVLKETLINKWAALLFAALLIGYNLYRITIAKSMSLISEFESTPENKYARMKILYRIYIVMSIVLFVLVIAAIVYYKKKYGNYDE